MGESRPDNTPVHRITTDDIEIHDDLSTDLYIVWRALRETSGSRPHTLDQCPGRIVEASIDDIVADLWGTLDDAEIAHSAAAVRAHLRQSGHLEPLPKDLLWICDEWDAPRPVLPASPRHTRPSPTDRPGGPAPRRSPGAAPGIPSSARPRGEAPRTGAAHAAGTIGGADSGDARAPQTATSATAGAAEPADAIEVLRRLVSDHDDADRLREAIRHRALPLLRDIDRRLGELLNALPTSNGVHQPRPVQPASVRTMTAAGEIRELAERIRAWDAERNRIQHAENHEGGAYSQWHGSDDRAVEIVRALQDILGDAARSRPVKYCPPENECEDCADIPADGK